MIEISNLTKHYGNIKAVSNLNFTVNEGEILGFLGPNGAGKSTTMNIITGCISSTKGVVKVCGFDIMENPKEVKKRIGYLPEQPPLYMDMTVTDYLDFVSDLKLADKKKKKKHLSEIMDLTKITDVKNRLIKNLSKGYKQRVGLAQALIGNPRVLILDEPTIGLDPRQILEMRKIIKNLGKEHTVILSSHILTEVSAVCDRVVIINKGKIVGIGTPDDLSKNIRATPKVIIKVDGPKETVSNTIKNIKEVKAVSVHGKGNGSINDYLVEATENIDVRTQLIAELVKGGFKILELKELDLSLEDIFLKLTKQEKEVM